MRGGGGGTQPCRKMLLNLLGGNFQTHTRIFWDVLGLGSAQLTRSFSKCSLSVLRYCKGKGLLHVVRGGVFCLCVMCVSVCRRSPTNGLSAREAASTSDTNLSWPDTRGIYSTVALLQFALQQFHIHMIFLRQIRMYASQSIAGKYCISHSKDSKTENSKQIFLEIKLCGLSPNSYIHVSMSDLQYITRYI